MGKDTTTDRALLLRAATLVRPALADKAFIPALMHIKFDGKWATAFNDRMAIAVRCSAALSRLVPGTLFIQGLGAFGGKEVVVHQNEDDSIVLRSGRSRVTLPTLPLDDFPLTWPKDQSALFDVSAMMLKAIERCLISVSTDATQPAQMGLTLETSGHSAVFFSTDNASLSRAYCKTEEPIALPGDVPIIIPRTFCEQLLALSKAFPDNAIMLGIGEGYVEAEFYPEGSVDMEARLFSRMPVDLDPLQFPKIIQRHCGDVATLKKRTAEVPEGLDAALARALLVMGNETQKRATAKVDGGTLSLRATSDFGDSDDSMLIDHDDVGPVRMDAAFVARGLKQASRIAITNTVTILTEGEHAEFVHMVSHVRENEK